MNQLQSRLPSPAEKDMLPRVGAGCLMLLGIVMFAAAVGFVFSRFNNDFIQNLLLAIIGIGFAGGGFAWFRHAGRIDTRRRDEFMEKEILAVGARHFGMATLAQVALESSLSAAEAEETLERLGGQGLVRPELQEDGTIIYRFHGLGGGAQGIEEGDG